MGGGDKARIRIGGVTILERVLARMTPQCARIILNANGDRARFADTGLPVVPTAWRVLPARSPASLPASIGQPRNAPEITEIASVPGDCPFLPLDLVTRLQAARKRKGSRSPARARANGAILSWDCGRWRCARICVTRW